MLLVKKSQKGDQPTDQLTDRLTKWDVELGQKQYDQRIKNIKKVKCVQPSNQQTKRQTDRQSGKIDVFLCLKII